ncbi:unnamed protein product [Vicia faba]|uniref:Uncharacterized protein n=1 Tax=Vicia faba TaxID=3906 RepID=A0AAV0ZJE0_VICFA|nr:unnamed protein product [Vicia faba]
MSKNCPSFSLHGIYQIRTSSTPFYVMHHVREHISTSSYLRISKFVLTARNRQICFMPFPSSESADADCLALLLPTFVCVRDGLALDVAWLEVPAAAFVNGTSKNGIYRIPFDKLPACNLPFEDTSPNSTAGALDGPAEGTMKLHGQAQDPPQMFALR